MSTIITLIIAGLSLVGAAVSLVLLRRLTQRLDAALGGVDTESLELQLTRHQKQMIDVDRRLTTLNLKYDDLVATSSVASQKISVVRFNPFGDTGGDQSFSLAVLDAHDSGYVLTSIHGRQGTRVYIKPVDFGKSTYSLSDEEQQALTQAVKRIPQLPNATS